MNLFKIRLIFCSRRCTEADRVPEIIGGKARHHRIDIDDAESLSGSAVKHNVVELRVIMGNAQGELPRFPLVLKN